VSSPHPELLIHLNRAFSAGGGTLPFARFMDIVLHTPGAGYYERAQIGRHGDFFTSPSVGPLFGQLLAYHAVHIWESLNKPQSFDLIEQGANDGTLANDILNTLENIAPKLYQHTRLHLLEPLESPRKRQQQTLANHAHMVHWHNPSAKPHQWQGLFYCNELLDAFPVHLVRRRNNHWVSLNVAFDNSTSPPFSWSENPAIPTELLPLLQRLPDNLPEGYTTELRPAIKPWLESVAKHLANGQLLVFDYGFPANEYYHPSRHRGTLQTYRNHRASDNPFVDAGHCDITAHVDFTHLTDTATSTGFHSTTTQFQAQFLTHAARPWLQHIETLTPHDTQTQHAIRQFHTLTHPALMGTKFLAFSTWR